MAILGVYVHLHRIVAVNVTIVSVVIFWLPVDFRRYQAYVESSSDFFEVFAESTLLVMIQIWPV